MAKSIIEDKKGFSKVSSRKSLIWSISSGFLAFLSLVALINYDPLSYHVHPPVDASPLLGKLGIFLARHLLGIFGISAWLMPVFFGFISFLLLKNLSFLAKFLKLSSIFALILSVSVIANLKDDQFRLEHKETLLNPSTYEHGAGGSLGAILYSGLSINSPMENRTGGYFKLWFGSLGTIVFSILLILFCLCFNIKLTVPISFLQKLLKSSELHAEDEICNKQKSQNVLNKKLVNPLSKINFKWPFAKESDDPLFGDVSKLEDSQTQKIQKVDKPKESIKQSDDPERIKRDKTKDAPAEDKPQISEPEKIHKDLKPNLSEPKVSSDGMEGFKVVRAAKTEKAIDLFPERKGDYHFPPMDLLMEPPEEESVGDEDHILKAKRLQDTLKEFKIEVEMGEVHTGPVITRYDLHPAAGVRVEKIANLDKNLAMALKAESVRILAPVPGKGCVGIEVPNSTPLPVCMKEILQSKAWHEAGAEIPIVLGKEASGKPLVADLTKMPHLLVAGSTGSGKTVCINSIIASLCYHSSPADVRFIMVDPKIVEMKVYNDLPHMLIPVVTEPKKVPGALKWLLIEMERRYQIFSKLGVRNIAGFNAKILKDKAEKEKAQLLDAEMTPEERAALTSVQVPRDDDALEIPENKLPYIVCIIDELADLMMVAQADVETGIARLAQLARAAGIHLIIATQRPSVNVITGVIKANLPSRISFRVASYRDSQTILDGKGAEALIGKGDMLFIPPGSSTFTRAQGAFVSDDEINGIVDFLKINGPPQIIEEVRAQIESAGEEDILGGDDDSDDDPMTRKAIEVIRSTKRASTSNLQRKLSIGYNRAARIMDDLEDRGLVGPDVPGQGREILMDL